MDRKSLSFLLVVLLALIPGVVRVEAPPVAPPEALFDFGLADMDESTMKNLAEQGSLIIVRQNPDQSLISVTSGRLVNAPLDVVWSTVIDFDNYATFMPQTEAQKIIKRYDENNLLVEQNIAIKIWRLPSLKMEYRMVQQLTPKKQIRFWWVEGEMEGTHGGWDVVSVGDQTIIFYSLRSPLDNLGLGLGSLFQSEPDFMAGINVTTAMVVSKAVQEECERRAKKK